MSLRLFPFGRTIWPAPLWPASAALALRASGWGKQVSVRPVS